METGFVALVIALAIAGTIAVVAAVILCSKFYTGKKKPSATQGTIYVRQYENESEPALLLEYSTPISDIVSRKRVVFDVKILK